MDSGRSSGHISCLMTAQFDQSKLKHFALISSYVDMIKLVGILSQLASCERITLADINLSEGTWIPILQTLYQLPKLRHLHICYPFQIGHPVFFLCPGAEQNHEISWQIEYNTCDYTLEDIPLGMSEEDSADASSLIAVPKKECRLRQSKDYKAPGYEKHRASGYYVCLRGHEIRAVLTRFVRVRLFRFIFVTR